MSRVIAFDPHLARARQDAFLDALISGNGIGLDESDQTHSMPLSLRPDERLAFACACGDTTAAAIRDAWRFNQPVTAMSAAELDSISSRSYTVFTGRESDILESVNE